MLIIAHNDAHRKRFGLFTGFSRYFFHPSLGYPESRLQALSEAQRSFAGVAESIGSPTEDDIQSWVNEERYGKAGQS
jgi:hypothetical protein